MSALCPEGHVTCPYNKSHILRCERIQFHLTKCEQSQEGKKHNVKYAVCPYNSTHLIPVTEINSHKTNTCPDRVKLESYVYEQASSKPLFPVQNIEVKSSENWDDVDVPTYNPDQHMENKKLLQLKQVVPPSERKRFHAEQRKKFQTITGNEYLSEKSKEINLRPPLRKPEAMLKPKSPEMNGHLSFERQEFPELQNLTIQDANEFQVVSKRRNRKSPPQLTDFNEEKPDKMKNNIDFIKNKVKNEFEQENQPSASASAAALWEAEPRKIEVEFTVVTGKKNRLRKH